LSRLPSTNWSEGKIYKTFKDNLIFLNDTCIIANHQFCPTYQEKEEFSTFLAKKLPKTNKKGVVLGTFDVSPSGKIINTQIIYTEGLSKNIGKYVKKVFERTSIYSFILSKIDNHKPNYYFRVGFVLLFFNNNIENQTVYVRQIQFFPNVDFQKWRAQKNIREKINESKKQFAIGVEKELV